MASCTTFIYLNLRRITSSKVVFISVHVLDVILFKTSPPAVYKCQTFAGRRAHEQSNSVNGLLLWINLMANSLFHEGGKQNQRYPIMCRDLYYKVEKHRPLTC